MDKQEYLSEIRGLCREIMESENLEEIEAKVHTLANIKTKFMQELQGYNQIKSCLQFDAKIEIIKWEHREGFDEDGRGSVINDVVFKLDDIQVEIFTEINPDWRGKLYIYLRINNIHHKEDTETCSELDADTLFELVSRAELGEKVYKFLIEFLNSFEGLFEIYENEENNDEIPNDFKDYTFYIGEQPTLCLHK